MLAWFSRKRSKVLSDPKFWRTRDSISSKQLLSSLECSTLPLDILTSKWNDDGHEFSSDGDTWYPPTRVPLTVFKDPSNRKLPKRYTIPEVREAVRQGELSKDDRILVTTTDKKPVAWRVHQLKAFCEYDVFVSYRHSSKREALELKRALEANGLRVWIDQERMELGGNVDTQLYDGVKSSATLVALFTANDSAKELGEQDYCKDERTFAFRNRKSVFPVRMMSQHDPDSSIELPDDLVAKNLLHIDLTFETVDKSKVQAFAGSILSEARSQPYFRPPSVAARKYWRVAEDSLRKIGLPANTAMLITVLLVLFSGLASVGIAIGQLTRSVDALQAKAVNQVLIDIREGEHLTYSASKNESSDTTKDVSPIHLNTKVFPTTTSPIEQLLSLHMELSRSSQESRNAILANWSGQQIASTADIRWRVKPKHLEKRSRIDVANSLGDMARIIQDDLGAFLANKDISTFADDWILVYFSGNSILVVHERNPSDDRGTSCESILFDFDGMEPSAEHARKLISETLLRRVSESSEEIRERKVVLLAGEFGIPANDLTQRLPAFKLLPEDYTTKSLEDFFEINRLQEFFSLDGVATTQASGKNRVRLVVDFCHVLNSEYKLERCFVWIPVIQ